MDDEKNGNNNNDANTAPPLAWNQLAEILTCLVVHDHLPEPLTLQDQQEIAKYVAWRWFETLCHPRMAFLAMHDMATRQVNSMLRYGDPTEPPVTIWSAHDSVLIGMMCAYRLNQPAVWPDYGSYLMIELVRVEAVQHEHHDGGSGSSISNDLYVRFSLNREQLHSRWANTDHSLLVDGMIPLAVLEEKIRTEVG